MDSYDHRNGSGIYIQIGAGAGDLDERAQCRDGFTEFIKRLPREHVRKIILVEPNPLNIPKLKECWKDYPESSIYEIGIVPKTHEGSSVLLHYCPLDAPHYQVASIDKGHVQKHYGHDCELSTFTIPVTSLEAFIRSTTTGPIELLSLDIEGIEAAVLLDISFDLVDVRYLSFEHLHLGDARERVLHHLATNRFEFVGQGVDHNGYDYLYVRRG
jgi:FkbM family methyltransferase